MELASKKGSIFIFFITIFLIHFSGFGQNSILQRKINIHVENKTVEEVLDLISKKGRLYFSYNSAIIDKNKVVSSFNEKSITIRDAISLLFEDEIKPIGAGKYVILRQNSKDLEIKEPEEIKKAEPGNRYTITGYIINSETGQRIPNATVYQIGKTNSVLANKDGRYSITVSAKKNNNIGLAYSSKNFQDTVIVVQPANHSINMRLKPKERPPEQIATKGFEGIVEEQDSVLKLEELALVKFAVRKRQFNLSKNLQFIEKHHIQLSLIPGFGTNRLMSGNVENNFSFNLLGGYSYAVNGFELGGILNIVRTDVKQAQIAGFANVVGGNTTGIQLAGFMNNNRQSVTGIQVAGFSNIVLDTITGIQFSGFSNVLKGKMNGLQLAGFSNVTTENVDGVQVSGFSNYARKDVKFAQLSGFVNYGKNVGGAQLSGFANIGADVGGAQIGGFINYSDGTVGGVQIAGFLNVANEVNSAQVAGFVNVSKKEITGVQISCINIAKKVNGVQLGLVNFADSVSGTSIGLISYVKQGLHKFELGISDNRYASISFKTGNHRFYNIFTGSINIDDGNYWSAGYGAGTEFRERKKFYFGFNFIGSYVNENFEIDDYVPINVHMKFEPHLGWRFFKSSAIAIAPSMNLLVTDWLGAGNDYGSSFAPYEMFEIEEEGVKISGWVGLSFVLRL
jgi:hypothetical protein